MDQEQLEKEQLEKERLEQEQLEQERLEQERLEQIDYTDSIDYKSFLILHSYIRISGKIIPKRLNNLTVKKQRQVSKAIKNARIMNFLLFFPGHSGHFRIKYKYPYKKNKKKKKYNKYNK